MTIEVPISSNIAPKPELSQLSTKDDQQQSLTDSQYKLLSWKDLKCIIEENRLSDLRRIPSDLRRYLAWSERIRSQYGSIQNFLLKERLGWTDQKPKNMTPFADPADFKVLINDWPYGTEPGILHLVSWTKSPIPTNETDCDLTPESRRIIERYVYENFEKHLNYDSVLWFKNWAGIQSVRSVEHIHVMIRNYSDDFVTSVVGNAGNGGLGPIVPIGKLIREEAESAPN